MHTRRLCGLLLGAWLAATIFMTWVATHNLQGVDTLLNTTSSQAQRQLRDVGHDKARVIMRFQASELNRYYFSTWEGFQIILGIVLAVMLLFATNGNRLMMTLAVGMLAIVFIQRLTVTPSIIELGRGLDFAADGQMQVERQAFWNYHNFYSALELIKLALGVGLGARLILSGSSGRRVRRTKKLDTVDDADNGHIDG
jgi:hypothetical protein